VIEPQHAFSTACWARRIAATWLLAAVALAATPAGAAQEDAEMERLRRDFGVAEATFNSIDQPDSVVDFDRIITVLERRLAAGRDDEARALLVASLSYRARAHFNNGANDEAAADMRALIAADPAAILDRV
jgi:hypothetical protein